MCLCLFILMVVRLIDGRASAAECRSVWFEFVDLVVGAVLASSLVSIMLSEQMLSWALMLKLALLVRLGSTQVGALTRVTAGVPNDWVVVIVTLKLTTPGCGLLLTVAIRTPLGPRL